jgi:hypothetical protein
MQLIAVNYHGADSSISYIDAQRHCQLFQVYASVNTNPMINLPHSHTEILALHVQERPLHLDFKYVNLLHLSAIPFKPSSSKQMHCRFNNTIEVMESRWRNMDNDSAVKF